MKKMKASREEIDQSIKEAFNMNRQESNERTERRSLTYYLGDTEDEVEEQPQAKAPSKETDCREVIVSEPSEPTLHTENVTIQRRISAKMRRGMLETYKQAFLIPTKERSKGSLSEQGDIRTCGLHRPQAGRQGQQPFKFCGEYRAHSFGGIW